MIRLRVKRNTQRYYLDLQGVPRHGLKLAPILLLLLSFASTANACTCGWASACEAYASASVVFVGRVTHTAFKAVPRSFPQNAISTTFINGGVISAQFKVEKAFLGVRVGSVEVLGEGTTCDFPFKTGERYLVFADKDSQTGTLHTSVCSGTALLADSNDTLAYLRQVAKRPRDATFSGEVVRELPPQNESGTAPIAKTEIIIENGAQQFRALTDGNGKFELRGIRPGRYRVHTNPATNSSRLDSLTEEPRKEWELEIPSHGCVQTWFMVRPEGEISGRVSDASGIVSAELTPELILADGALSEIFFRTGKLSEEKTFKFSFVPAGRYYLGFNLRSGPDIESPYPEFYYPGVADRSKATVITLSEGQKLADLSLPRPLRLAERLIEGFAVWPDGKPFVDHCGITLTNPRTDYREGNCVPTDLEGRFKIKAIEGQTYHLAGTIVGPDGGLISSKPVVLKVEKENSPVKLVVESP